MLHANQNRCGSIAAKAGRELVCLVALGQQPWLSPVSVPKFSPKKRYPVSMQRPFDKSHTLIETLGIRICVARER